MSTKIYTRRGDDGTTGLVGNTRLDKGHLRIESYGTLDELNSFLGLATVELEADGSAIEKTGPLVKMVRQIQHHLFDLGSRVACNDPQMLKKLPVVAQSDIQILETEMDRMSRELPELKSFILPGGTRTASLLHIARTIARRAERATVRLSMTETVDTIAIPYLNRLSDFLFIAARFANHISGQPEVLWQKSNSPPHSEKLSK